MFDPVTERWISEDPRGYRPDDLNLYVYCHNDPVNNTDPSGLDVVTKSESDAKEWIAWIGGDKANSGYLGQWAGDYKGPKVRLGYFQAPTGRWILTYKDVKEVNAAIAYYQGINWTWMVDFFNSLTSFIPILVGWNDAVSTGVEWQGKKWQPWSWPTPFNLTEWKALQEYYKTEPLPFLSDFEIAREIARLRNDGASINSLIKNGWLVEDRSGKVRPNRQLSDSIISFRDPITQRLVDEYLAWLKKGNSPSPFESGPDFVGPANPGATFKPSDELTRVICDKLDQDDFNRKALKAIASEMDTVGVNSRDYQVPRERIEKMLKEGLAAGTAGGIVTVVGYINGNYRRAVLFPDIGMCDIVLSARQLTGIQTLQGVKGPYTSYIVISLDPWTNDRTWYERAEKSIIDRVEKRDHAALSILPIIPTLESALEGNYGRACMSAVGDATFIWGTRYLFAAPGMRASTWGNRLLGTELGFSGLRGVQALIAYSNDETKKGDAYFSEAMLRLFGVSALTLLRLAGQRAKPPASASPAKPESVPTTAISGSRAELPKGWTIIEQSENRITIVSDLNPDLQMTAVLDGKGTLRYRVKAEPKGQGIGSQLYDVVMAKFEGRVTAIEEAWIPALPDNLNTFNTRLTYYKSTGMPENLAEIQAAKDTFGGKMAGRKGFTDVMFLPGTVQDPVTGIYTNVLVRFTKSPN